MSPLIWEALESQSCPVFGSAASFAAAYRAKFQEEPLPESAAAAAGGMALLAAIQEVRSLEQDAVRQARCGGRGALRPRPCGGCPCRPATGSCPSTATARVRRQ